MSEQGMEPFAAFEHHLSQWLGRAEEPPSEPVPRQVEPLLARTLEERLQQLHSYLDRAERDAEQAVAPISADIQSLRQWLDALSMARGRLAQRTV
jgi:hypothetical protein